MAQCGTCKGWGTVPAPNNNPGRVPCPEANCHGGVLYDEPAQEQPHTNDKSKRKDPFDPPPMEDILFWVGVIVLVIIADSSHR